MKYNTDNMKYLLSGYVVN